MGPRQRQVVAAHRQDAEQAQRVQLALQRRKNVCRQRMKRSGLG